MTASLTTDDCVVRATHLRKGRIRYVEPAKTAVRHLHYGRIRLDAADAALAFDTGGHETGLVTMAGAVEVRVGAQSFSMAPYDSLYLPRDTRAELRPGAAGCDLVEVSAPVEGRYPLQFVAWKDVLRDPGLHWKAGHPPSERTINILLGKNVEAGRIVIGITFPAPGNWMSWPPHEHSDMLEEAYLYVDMPAPAFGIQLVYTDPASPELAVVVHEGDVVLMPKGYHPGVSSPSCGLNFLWMMAAVREGVDRQFGVVNVQPEFATSASGLEAGKATK
jgi:5-deoxy-glucuronate isomerase